MSIITTGQLFSEWQQMNQKLQAQIEKQNEIITKQQEMLERLDEPIPTQLTGSIVEEDYAINRLEIRDTNNHEVYIDLSKYSKVYFSCTSTLDVDPKLDFRIKRSIPNDFAGTQKYLVDGQWVVTEFSPRRWDTYHLNDALPFLNNLIAKEIMIRASCATVPTAGNLSILFWGVA